jgi:hypothetical protein
VAFNYRDAVGGRSADANAGIRPEIGGEMSEPEEPGGKQPEGAAGDLRAKGITEIDLLGRLSMVAIDMLGAFVPDGTEVTVILRDLKEPDKLMVTSNDHELAELVIRAFAQPGTKPPIVRAMTTSGPISDATEFKLNKSN